MFPAVDVGDAEAAVRRDRDIHDLMSPYPADHRLSALHALFLGQTALFMHLAKPRHEDLEEIYALHAPLVEATLAGDPVKAEELACHHNTEDGERLRERMIGPTK